MNTIIEGKVVPLTKVPQWLISFIWSEQYNKWLVSALMLFTSWISQAAKEKYTVVYEYNNIKDKIKKDLDFFVKVQQVALQSSIAVCRFAAIVTVKVSSLKQIWGKVCISANYWFCTYIFYSGHTETSVMYVVVATRVDHKGY